MEEEEEEEGKGPLPLLACKPHVHTPTLLISHIEETSPASDILIQN